VVAIEIIAGKQGVDGLAHPLSGLG
jgi:hypothetical protein